MLNYNSQSCFRPTHCAEVRLSQLWKITEGAWARTRARLKHQQRSKDSQFRAKGKLPPILFCTSVFQVTRSLHACEDLAALPRTYRRVSGTCPVCKEAELLLMREPNADKSDTFTNESSAFFLFLRVPGLVSGAETDS